MVDQAFELRRQSWENNREAKYISVSSGKGGVGKTNLVVNLGFWLSQMGYKTLIFDADLGLANIDILLSLNISTSIKRYLKGEVGIEEMLQKNIYGMDVFPASSGIIELTSLSEEDFQKIIDIFIKLDKEYDYIIFDNGAGISDNILKLAAMTDEVIVVTNPEPTAITDAYALMKVLRSEYSVTGMKLIVNRSEDINSSYGVFKNLEKVTERFLNINLEYLGAIREDAELKMSVKIQKPLSAISPRSNYAMDIRSIANNIAGIQEKTPSKLNISSFFRRIVR